jgi:hypothetical protein
MLRKKWIAGLAASLVLGGASIAAAQDVIGADGGPPGAPPGGNYTQQGCGAEQFNLVRTQSTPSVTSSTTFAGIPGTAFPFAVPANQSRCVKVLLTAETSCTDSNANDYCYVQALIDGVPMDPDGQGFQAIDSEDATASAHAYEWVARVGAGNHVLELEQRVRNNNTVLRLDDWTQDITIKG